MSLLGFRSYKRARWLKFLTQKYRLVLMEKFLLNMFQRNQILLDDPCFFDRTVPLYMYIHFGRNLLCSV